MTDKQRTVRGDFGIWLDKAPLSMDVFFQHGLIVLDASVLLDLYRMTPDARSQVLDTLSQVKDRLWVPHQAVLEFVRGRKQVVISRTNSYKAVEKHLKAATAEAVSSLEKAVSKLLDLRELVGTSVDWNPTINKVDRESLSARLQGALEPALRELSRLEAEHDLQPGDLRQGDSVLTEVDDLLRGRIGAAFATNKIRTITEEAVNFRYPNKMPPGFADANKGTDLGAAGDYILWCQTIEHVVAATLCSGHVMLITRDLKEDWWALDSARKPRGPHPDLVQEFRDITGADLHLSTLRDFIRGAGEYLSADISPNTIGEIDKASEAVRVLLDDDTIGAQATIKGLLFEKFVEELFIAMGFRVERVDRGGYDFRALDKDDNLSLVDVCIRLDRSRLGHRLDRLLRDIDEESPSYCYIVTDVPVRELLIDQAAFRSVKIIDRPELDRLIAVHMPGSRFPW